jgi:hypothetical protein
MPLESHPPESGGSDGTRNRGLLGVTAIENKGRGWLAEPPDTPRKRLSNPETLPWWLVPRQGGAATFPPSGHSRVIQPDRDNSFSTISNDLLAANVFEIAEFSFQVVAVLYLSNVEFGRTLQLLREHKRGTPACPEGHQ